MHCRPVVLEIYQRSCAKQLFIFCSIDSVTAAAAIDIAQRTCSVPMQACTQRNGWGLKFLSIKFASVLHHEIAGVCPAIMAALPVDINFRDRRLQSH